MVLKIMNKDDDINNFVPSLLNPRRYKKSNFNSTLTQNSVVSRFSLSLGPPRNRVNEHQKSSKDTGTTGSFKENVNPEIVHQPICRKKTVNGVLDVTDATEIDFRCNEKDEKSSRENFVQSIDGTSAIIDNCLPLHNDKSLLSGSSRLSTVSCVHDTQKESDETVILRRSFTRQPRIRISFALTDNRAVDVNSKSCEIKRVAFNYEHNNVTVNCDLIENSKSLSDHELDDNMHKSFTDETKKVLVNLEIRKKLNAEGNTEDSRVLILKTNAIEKFGHVTVQPPNYKLEKRKIIHDNWKGNKRRLVDATLNNGNFASIKLKQKSIHDFLPKIVNVFSLKDTNADQIENVASVRAMSKNSCVGDTNRRTLCKANDRNNESPRSVKTASMRREIISPRSQDVKSIRTETPSCNRNTSAKVRNECASAHWPRKGIETLNFSLPAKSKSNRTSISPRSIPHHKIVAGTYFAVDAFSYGDIPNVKNYFLTHFHSDHYTGLKKSFNKQLFCSRITADLCISRLGVNPKSIHVVSIDETIRIDGVEITAVDANHCPGALMLVFTLPNGKTLLHTGDFRASHTMESYPIFWNKDIHTVYLDTTYCNPRYDFPTQDQSLEMALQILKQKKTSLESAGKKFSSVLIVCGTYTIGKEKFFLGIARRVGCTVWACPEKDRILKVVEGQGFSHLPPQSCQLHVVPMRDLTHEKLRSYMDSLKGTFSEVVAFKPSGWENGKNSCIEKDFVTIHGIPYSEHSSFSELIRFIKFLKPKQVVPTVDISGGVKAVQKYFPCPLVSKDDVAVQSKVTDYFSLQNRQQVPAVT